MKFILFLTLGLPSFGYAASGPDFAADVQAARGLLEQEVHADTSNPPGNESRIVALIAPKLKDAGIPYEIVEFGPGRQNIVARLKGTGPEKPLLLLAHIDVVGADQQKWTSDPHTLTEKDGYLVGRGISDDLGMGAVELQIFLDLKKYNVPLRRDVIFALTGDEESGGLGVRYLLENRPELLDAGIALNEGGGLILGENGKVKLAALQSAEKSYQDFEITAKGTTGHSSVPLPDNAIYRLAHALDRMSHFEAPAHLVPVTRAYFSMRAQQETGRLAAAMNALVAAKGPLPPAAVKVIEKDPMEGANLRTTCVATTIRGGNRVNALPAEAVVNINCRILPDETIPDVQKRLERAIADKGLEVKPVGVFGVAGSSPVDNEVPAAVVKVLAEKYPNRPVIPTMSRGATDSRYLRMKGVAAYGLSPIAISEADARRAHGIDERILVASLQPGMEFFYALVTELAAVK